MAFRAMAYQEMLEKDGIPPEQARAHARALETFVADEQITRKDLEAVAKELRAEIVVNRQQLEATAKELRAEMAAGYQKLDAKIDATRQHLDVKIDQLDAKIDRLDARTQQRLAELKFEMVRWMAGFSIGTVVTLVVAIWRFGRM